MTTSPTWKRRILSMAGMLTRSAATVSMERGTGFTSAEGLWKTPKYMEFCFPEIFGSLAIDSSTSLETSKPLEGGGGGGAENGRAGAARRRRRRGNRMCLEDGPGRREERGERREKRED